MALVMSFEPSFIKVHVAEIPCRVSRHLNTELRKFGITAFSACSYGFRVDLRSKPEGGNEAATGSAIPLLRTGIATRAERNKRTPLRRSERHRDTRSGIVEVPGDIAFEPLDID